jgi:hypothetical protein
LPEPNPIWGLHLAPGAIAGALVRRVGDGYEVLDTFVEPAPGDAAGLRKAAQETVRRDGIAGRASLTAVADHELAVGTGKIPSDELYLNDEEVYHHLHDFAPFEPGEGQIVYRSVGSRDERQYALAAIPDAAQDGLEDLALLLDERMHGIGLSTPSLARGARAIGLIDGRTFLVDVQGTQTVILAVDGHEERRYLIATGLDRCGGSMSAVEMLAADLLRVLAYHAEVARREKPEDDDVPSGDVVLVGAHAARARELLDRALGDRLAPTSRRAGKPERIQDARGAALGDDVAHSHAAAIGAALEAFLPAPDRLVLRHPPDDVPEYTGAPPASGKRGGNPWPLLGLAAVALLAGGAWWAAGAPGLGAARTTEVVKEIETNGATLVDRPSEPVKPAGPTEAEIEGAAHAALVDLALRVAHARARAAAYVALGSGSPPHRLRSYRAPDVRGTLRVELLADVEGGITPDVRRNARAAVEAVPGIEQVSIDVADGALRVRCRSAVAPRPEPGDGDRAPSGGLLTTIPSGTPRGVVPRDADGRPQLSVADIRALLDGAGGDGSDVLLTPTQLAFALDLLEQAAALSSHLTAHGNAAPTLGAATAGTDGAVTLRLVPAPERAVPLSRRLVPHGPWQDAGRLGGGSEQLVDHVPGASGRYQWRAGSGDDAPTVEADVTIAVDVELVDVDGTSGAPRFRLARGWRGERITAEMTVTADDAPIRTEKGGVLLDSGLRFDAIARRTETETGTEQVPEFLPDGRVKRDDAGEPVLVERAVERSVPVVEVRAQDAQGAVRTWVRKMTDG